MSVPLRVDVWSDIVCPWCYVGREHLVRAVAASGLADRVEIHHHAYQLHPEFGASRPLPQWLRAKFGPNYAGITQRVGAVAERVGLTLDFEHATAADTRAAHRLVKAAQSHGKADAMVERLMRAHFTDRLDVADPDVLRRLGAELGVPDSAVANAITGKAYESDVLEDLAAAQAIGIQGVPFFVLDLRYGVSGAQPVEYFVEALRKAAAPPQDPDAAEEAAA